MCSYRGETCSKNNRVITLVVDVVAESASLLTTRRAKDLIVIKFDFPLPIAVTFNNGNRRQGGEVFSNVGQSLGAPREPLERLDPISLSTTVGTGGMVPSLDRLAKFNTDFFGLPLDLDKPSNFQ